jgi:hypothetical protein
LRIEWYLSLVICSFLLEFRLSSLCIWQSLQRFCRKIGKYLHTIFRQRISQLISLPSGSHVLHI